MSGARDRYDSARYRADDADVDEEPSRRVARANAAYHYERFKIRGQDHFAAELIYAAACAYNAGERVGFPMFLLDEFAHAYRARQLEGEKLRLDRDRFHYVGRTLGTFMRAEWIAQREAARAREEHERATTTRRIVRTTNSTAVSNPLVVPTAKPGALARRGALYGG